MGKTFGLESVVRAEAAKSGDEVTNRNHHYTCTRMVKFADKYKNSKGKPYPFAQIAYIGVGRDSHKATAFNKGYRAFDNPCAKEVLKMCKAFGEYNHNVDLMRNGNVCHAMFKLHMRHNYNLEKFISELPLRWHPYPKAPKTMKEVVDAFI